jgi:hypothetical protein
VSRCGILAFGCVRVVFSRGKRRLHKSQFLWGLCVDRVSYVFGQYYAEGGIRTPTPGQAPPPQDGVSTRFHHFGKEWPQLEKSPYSLRLC